MAFCSNCGKELNNGAKFCQSCGTLLETENKPKQTEELRKCPSCGVQLPSFTAICPYCNHEINAQRVSSSLKEFINLINEYDKVIANDPEPPKTGWKTWSKGKRFLWVVLNLFTSFIPLVIYLTFPLIKPFFAKECSGTFR